MKQIVLFAATLFFPTFFGSGWSYIFTATDIDGNTHDIQDYLDQGKPVLIMDLVDNWGQYWAIHEDGTHIDIYNTIGQGGTGEVVVLYIAGWGFDSESEIYDVDYSADLGPSYASVDLTENNPIPIIVAADNPGVDTNPKGARQWLCPEGSTGWLPASTISVEEVLNVLYDNCCTAVEGEDPGIILSSSGNACDPTEFGYTLSNHSAIALDQVIVDVYLNGQFLETVPYDQILEGCTSVALNYNNESILEGDEVSMYIDQPNWNLSNDSISITRNLVDTVGTTLKFEVLNPSGPNWNWVYYNVDGQSGEVSPIQNWYNYAFLDPGCHLLNVGSWEDTESQDTVIVGSVDENDNYVDTLFYGTVLEISQGLQLTIYAEGEAAVQKTWGYVFEDVSESQVFSPSAPRVQGIEVTHGSQTTFTDADGYYEFDLIPGESTFITYDETIWPVFTTPNAGNTWNDVVQNFGLNSDDPVWELTSNFDMGLPYMCETGIWNYFSINNSGNQPASGELVFTHDPLLTPVSISPEPTVVNGNELTFTIPELQYGGGQGVNIAYEELPADLLGELLSAEYTLNTIDDQGNVVDTQSSSVADTLFCAYDPNDKFGFPLGQGDEGFIPAETPLKYRIRFQNTGNFPATTVVIRDTLPETLDWESFEPAGATHDNVVTMNSETREVVWTFNDIQLPDSASDPLGSIGTLWFDIEMSDLGEGDLIENTAYIYFDQNEAIVTNTSVHTIQGVLSLDPRLSEELWVYPNPSRGWLIVGEGLPAGSIVELRDIKGRLVMKQIPLGGFLDLSRLEAGLYFLRVQGSEAKSTKIVVAK